MVWAASTRKARLLDFSSDEVDARESIRDNSRAHFLVLDHSKFSRSAHVRGGHITDASIVFCDRAPPAEIQEMIVRSSAELVLCPSYVRPHNEQSRLSQRSSPKPGVKPRQWTM